MKYIAVAAIALMPALFGIVLLAVAGSTAAPPAQAAPAFWVCGEDAPSPEATCTPTPSITPYVVTATFSPTPEKTNTPRPTKTPTEEATQTPVIIIVTATSTPGNPERRTLCTENCSIQPPATGSAGLADPQRRGVADQLFALE